MTIGGHIATGPAAIVVLLLLELVYYTIIKTCCQDIGDYQSFHDNLPKPVETTSTILDALGRLCLRNSAGDPNNIGQLESQASPPPPYRVCVLLLELFLPTDVLRLSQMNSQLTSATESKLMVLDSHCIMVSKFDNPYDTL